MAEQTEPANCGIRVKARYDFKGQVGGLRLLFRHQDAEAAAVAARERQAAYFRYLPVQGVVVENICDDLPPYCITEEVTGLPVSYAPLEVVVMAHTMEDLLNYIIREDLSKVELLAPDALHLTRFDLERMIFRLGEAMRRNARVNRHAV